MRWITSIYTYILLFIILYLGVVDMALYSYWGFKLDITPLLYIKTPGDAMASVSIWEILFLLSIFTVLYAVSIVFYRRYFRWNIDKKPVKWYMSIPASYISIGVLFIVARGGVGVAAMNLSRVYFHQERFANHSAINVTWNTIYSFIEREKLQEHHSYMDEDKALENFVALRKNMNSDHVQLIKPGSNVLLFILESFSNKVISALGGEEGITPRLDSLCESSIVFTNFYASGDRSDKGLVSIFSGYPAQPTTSIIDYPSKSQKLPFLYEIFAAEGYTTAFYYGGDLNFANFKSYFSNPGLHKLVTADDFSRKDHIQKWGVPDGIVFRRMLEDLDHTNQPFFYSCFSLSSHEPFDVPMEPVFGINSRDELSKNGFYYTDYELGEFLKKASVKSWWKNTLVIITADHGSRSPGNTSNHSKEKFSIPMIWTGGAVKENGLTISRIGSQTDLPATLLAQFKLDYSEFIYSNDLLNGNKGFAFYAFNNGFGFTSDEGFVIYDNDFDKCIFREGKSPDPLLITGKAFLQVLSTDFFNR
ncbi:MAG: LTA synthase family protein [Bacteroidales bacterium]